MACLGCRRRFCILLILKSVGPASEQSKVSLKYQDAAEIAELDRRFKEQQDRNARTKK
jgi:hypothetical protein